MVNQSFVLLSQAAYGLILLAFLNVSKLWLHGFALAGSLAAVAYCFMAEQEPMFVPLAWHAAFAILNAFSLLALFARRVWKKRKSGPKLEKMDPLEEFLKKTAFAHFPENDVIDFLRLGVEGEVEKGKQIMKAGDTVSEFYCVVQGLASGSIKNVKQADYPPGRLIGESVLLGVAQSPLDVTAHTDMKLLAWSTESIEHWTAQKPKNLSILQALVGTQMVERILEKARAKNIKETSEEARVSQ